MLVRDNLVHSDLHPGNIAVVANADGVHHEERREWWRPITDALPDRVVATFEVYGIGRPAPNFTLYLLDTGLVTELSGRSKDIFRKMIQALMRQDVDGMASVIIGAHEGRISEETNVKSFGEECASIVITCLYDVPEWERFFATREEYMNSGVTVYSNKIMEVFTKHRVRLDPEVWSTLTSLCLLESSMRELSKGVNAIHCITPYAFDLIHAMDKYLERRVYVLKGWLEHFRTYAFAGA